MLRPFGPGLPSDAIAHRFGWDGYEPDVAVSFCKRHESLGVRSAFVINTYYPEIAGGAYVNRALIDLIDRAMRATGVCPAVLDIYRDDRLVPIEGEGQLLEDEEYALVTASQALVGVLKLWQFHVGGGGSFYGDDIVLDVVLPEGRIRRIVDEVESRCRAAAVKFSRLPAPTEFRKRPTGFWSWLVRLR
jgi:hypothetical protein